MTFYSWLWAKGQYSRDAWVLTFFDWWSLVTDGYGTAHKPNSWPALNQILHAHGASKAMVTAAKHTMAVWHREMADELERSM